MYTRSPVLSATVLNASAAIGSFASGLRMTTSLVFGCNALHRRPVERAGQAIDDEVEQLLHALVHLRRAAVDRA